MVAQASSCDRERLRRLLAGDLSKRHAEDVARHVETCDGCRLELEALAAAESWWQEARCFLSGPDAEDAVDDRDTLAAAATIDLETTAAEVQSFLEPSDNPTMLGRLGGYEILQTIGRGGMGIVLKAYDGELNRYLAIKVLAPHYAGSAAARRRFAREAKAAAAVVHQHVVAIHSVDASGKLPYLVMPLVACETLEQRLDRQGPLDVEEVLRIALQAAQGLAAAHAHGLIHRDVKPANILLEKGVDRVLLTDFGLARAIDDASLTHSGVIAGTPQYMSPEQAKGEPIDHRSDLFSLGSVLYAMSTGRPPFRAETTMGIIRRVCDTTPRSPQEVNPEVPAWLCRLIARLQAKDPAGRFQSADQVARLLENCLAHVQHPTSVPLPAAVRRFDWTTNRRSKAFWAAAALPLLVVGVAVTMALLQTDTESPGVQGLQPPEDHAAGGLPGQTAESASESESLPWQDGVEQELMAIERSIEQLDRRLRQEDGS